MRDSGVVDFQPLPEEPILPPLPTFMPFFAPWKLFNLASDFVKMEWAVYLLIFCVIPHINPIKINACCPQGSALENNACVVNGTEIHSDGDGKTGNATSTFKQFTFEINLPICEEDEMIVTIEGSELTSQGEADYEFVDVPAITDSGYLRYDEAYYSPQEFCILQIPTSADGNIGIRICKPTCTESITCIPKCCLLNEILEINTTPTGGLAQTCVPANGTRWHPTIYTDLDTPFGAGDPNSPVHIKWEEAAEWNMSECHEVAIYRYTGPFRRDFRILSSSEVMYRGMTPKWQKVEGKYCVDGTGESGVYSGYENDTVILNCFPRSEVSIGADYTLGKVYYAVMIISSFFLLLTIIVYGILWERHTIHGFCLLSYFISLLLMQSGYISAFVLSEQSILRGNNLVMSSQCLAVAVFAHFAVIHAFSWMTIVNFDLWCTFRNLKSTLTSDKGLSKYLKYVFFAISLPTLIVGVGLGLDLSYGDAMPYERSLILPDYGKRKCYLSNPDGRLPYIIGPIAVILTINLFFFVTTLIALRQANEGSKLARLNGPTARQSYVPTHSEYGSREGIENSSSQLQLLKPFNLVSSGHFRITLIAKLICVMGVSWVFEVISSAETLVGGDVGSNAVPWYWVILDLINHFQGLIIFIFFVCKRDIITSLRQKIQCLDALCNWFAKYIPCCNSRQCGSRPATTMTTDSDNDGRQDGGNGGKTKSTKIDSSRGSSKSASAEKSNKAERPFLNDQVTTSRV